jgi:hypothetical protein
MDKALARNLLVTVVQTLAAEKRAELERHKEGHNDLARPDFIWHYLLQSFSTMGGVSGSKGLIGNQDNYRRVTYTALAALTPEARAAQVRQVCRAAGIRWPNKKAKFILGCFDYVTRLGGLETTKAKLLSLPGREAKVAFLKSFPGIDEKYARNIMMDVYHEDFRDSVALDSRIKGISEGLGLSFTSYLEEEAFYLEVAKLAGLNGWELDRLLFNFLSEVKTRLGISQAAASRKKTPRKYSSGDKDLSLARDAGFANASTNPKVVTQLKQLHKLVLSVCPDCLIKQRDDGGWIYVPPERRYDKKDKNLLTMWARENDVFMRIMYPKPSPGGESYDSRRGEEYLKRLKDLWICTPHGRRECGPHAK